MSLLQKIKKRQKMCLEIIEKSLSKFKKSTLGNAPIHSSENIIVG